MRENTRDAEKTSHFLHRDESRQYSAASTVCNQNMAKQSCVLEQRPRADSARKVGIESREGGSPPVPLRQRSIAQAEERNDSRSSDSLRGRRMTLRDRPVGAVVECQHGQTPVGLSFSRSTTALLTNQGTRLSTAEPRTSEGTYVVIKQTFPPLPCSVWSRHAAHLWSSDRLVSYHCRAVLSASAVANGRGVFAADNLRIQERHVWNDCYAN